MAPTSLHDEDLRTTIRKYALQNAVRHRKPPRIDAVVKKLIGEHPEFKTGIRDLMPVIKKVVMEVSKLDVKRCEEELKRLAPELLAELAEAGERREEILPPLPDADRGVVMRFAPNPNGPPTLGSARGIIVNSEYARRYKGRFILRFDDTDPVLKRPLLEAYDWYLEDCEWLDARPDEVVIASERLKIYYEHAKRLIELGGAYVCFCGRAEFKKLKDASRECPHRNADVEENLERWKRMLDGKYEPGDAVLRVKTDMRHKDPALRDWVAFRILKATHPRPSVADKYCVWPTLDFESAIEDHILGVTHIIRGKDLMDSEGRQRFLYKHFGWEYPITILWGRLKIHEFGKLSTSELRRRIESGEFDGWDDPRVPTIRALRRRGFEPEAIRRFFLNLGVTENDVAISLKNLYAENRKLIDEKANRYFFVTSPQELHLVKNGEEFQGVARALLHPNRRDFREIEVRRSVFINGDDARTLRVGGALRLKYLCDVEIVSEEPLTARVVSDAEAIAAGADDKKKPVIQWVPAENYIHVVVKRPEVEKPEELGIGEPLIKQEVGDVVQFERYGFVRVDSVEGQTVIAYFTH